jgi:putative membrane protein
VHVVAWILVALASALHVAIFVMESVMWTTPSVWKRFGLASQEDAETTRPMAYNQGFYNLFLAIVGFVGVVLDVLGNPAGFVLMIVATASMAAAAAVLITSGAKYLRPALTQGTLPLLGLVAVLVAG